MPQLNGGGGDDLGANDEMIAFKDEGDHEEKIREENAFTSDLADLKSSLVNESEINSSTAAAVRPQHIHTETQLQHSSINTSPHRNTSRVSVPENSCVCEQVIRRGHTEDQRVYTDKRQHLDEGKRECVCVSVCNYIGHCLYSRLKLFCVFLYSREESKPL